MNTPAAAAGYSGTPLVRKLGIKAGMRVRLFDPPPDYARLVAPLPDRVRFLRRSVAGIEFMHGFVTSRKALADLLAQARRFLARDGMLWISWPKKASGMTTEIGEANVRQAGLRAGLVDVKICAVNETWSGLKFVYRLADR